MLEYVLWNITCDRGLFYTYLHIMAQIELSLEFGLTTNMAYFQALKKYFKNSILTLES